MSFSDSLWFHTAGGSFKPRPPLPGDIDVDVAIVGGGYTGLWTAYYLHDIDPTMRIAIVRARDRRLRRLGPQRGLVLGAVPTRVERHRTAPRPDAAVAVRQAMHEAVAEVGRVAEAEGIDIHYARGGTVELARNEAQLARARELRGRRAAPDGPRRGASSCSRRRMPRDVRAPRESWARVYKPHCAAIHPAAAGPRARLLRGEARRLALRAHEGHRDPARRRGHGPRHRSRRDRGARHRGLHAQPAPVSAGRSSRSTR